MSTTKTPVYKRYELGISGHANSSGPVPTVAAGASANTAGADTPGATDNAGSITINAKNATGAMATITFALPFAATPKSVVFSPTNANAQAAGLYLSAKSATAFTVSCAVAPSAAATLTFDYRVSG